MKLKYRRISEFISYTNNPKDHPTSQVRKIAGSIKEFGFLVPLLIDDENSVIAGVL